MRKLIFVLATAILTLGLMVGCSKEKQEINKGYTADDVVGTYKVTLSFYYFEGYDIHHDYDDYKTNVLVSKNNNGGLDISIEGKTISCSYALDPQLHSVFHLSFLEQQWNGFTVKDGEDKTDFFNDSYIDADNKDIFIHVDVIKHGDLAVEGSLSLWK